MHTRSQKVVLITGGSKGLGYTLAKHLIQEQARLILWARSQEELKRAQAELHELGGHADIQVCDVCKMEEVKAQIHNIIALYGHLDIVINCAGIMIVGPMESYSRQEYKTAMDVMYWGIVNTTLAALPHMKEMKNGQIVNITSVGGMVSIPHMLPYTASKFAAVGFSLGAAAELRKENIFVTTVVPGLMRTGSYINAFFQENNKSEFKLFSLMSTAPLLTMSSDKAARLTLQAMKKKKVLKVLGMPAKALIGLQHLMPETTVMFFNLVSRFLPAKDDVREFERGEEIRKNFEDSEVPVFSEIGKVVQEKHQPWTNS